MRTDKRVFALGFFDGVHRGHQVLLEECRGLADRLDCKRAAITFDRHPQSLFTANPPTLISDTATRHLLLRRYGMDHIHTYPVTPEVMGMPWQDFVAELVEFGAAGFVCGDDFRFGAMGRGNARLLAEYCGERGLPCIIVPEQMVDGRRISSTYIRTQIECGDMETAVRFLGHPWAITGTVVHGQKLGRTLGIPTANLLLPQGIVSPRYGVYACRALIDGKSYPAVTNVGIRPTVSGQGTTVEPWILDFEGDLYDREITLEFHRFLRPEVKFPDLAALQEEIRKNAEETRAYFQGI